MIRRTFTATAVALALSFLSTVAMATAQRTFVASYGNDANVCSLTLPCRGFAAAVAQTMSDGEVVVLDSAGYGPVVLTQSVSIIAPAGVYAGITVASSQVGVTLGGGTKVVLRGLSISSMGTGNLGIQSWFGGTDLSVENCVVSGFMSNRAISIQSPSKVRIADTIVRDNAWGIEVGFGSVVNIIRSQVLKNMFMGILISGGTMGTTSVYIDDTLITGTARYAGSICIQTVPPAGTAGNIYATRVTVTDCHIAITSNGKAGGNASVSLSNSMITGNEYGLIQDLGAFNSLGNNHVDGNEAAVVDHELVAEDAAQVRRDQARDQVVAGAGFGGDDADGFDGPGLGVGGASNECDRRACRN